MIRRVYPWGVRAPCRCKSAAVPSKCYSKAEAAKLPPSVFHCSPDAGYPQVAHPPRP